MNINFRNYWFEQRFNRKPKVWTLDMIHDLYLKSKERFDLRQLDIKNCLNEIVETTPKNSKGEHIIYFYHETDKNNIWCYKFSYSDEHRSYTTLRSRVIDRGSNREDKLDFLTSNEKQFELGDKYRKLQKLLSKHHYFLFKLMSDMLEEHLRKHYKEKNVFPEDIFIVKIGETNYFVKTDTQHRYGYMRFEIKNKFIDSNIININ